MASPTSPTGAMPTNANQPLQPTWHGFVGDTREALTLFEAVIQGQLSRVVRRPHDRERGSLIRSGSVFIYEENNSGIKRWTDGVPWSPSRILGNFLIYRELDKPFPPGEKKRAKKPGQRKESITEDGLVGVKTEDGVVDGQLNSPTTPQTPVTPGGINDADREAERSLVGSLTDSYAFKEGGLVKKTMSVSVQSIHYHLVSYYNPDDVKQNSLPKPHDTHLRYITPRPELVRGQSFRTPLEESGEEQMVSPYGHHSGQQQQQRSPYGVPHGFMAQGQYIQHPQAYSAMPYQPPYYQAMPHQHQSPYEQGHYMQQMQHAAATGYPQPPPMGQHPHPSMQHPYSPQHQQGPYSHDPRYRQPQGGPQQQQQPHSQPQSPYSPHTPQNMTWQTPQ